MAEPAFRRRILIEPAPGCVVAELEDDWHRMVVTLHHADGIARAVNSEMKRWPWTTCLGAIAQLTATFTNQPLAEFARRGAKAQNCTHLHDLAVFAAAHADGLAPVAYDTTVTDPSDGQREARILRDGLPVMAWVLADAALLGPAEVAGLTLFTLNEWIASLGPDKQEAARILRWAAILGFGRAMDIPEGTPGTAFPGGSCHTFQPAIAATAIRRPDVPRDFSQSGIAPLAEHSAMFGNAVG